MTTISRRMLLDKIYVEFLIEIKPFVYDISKVIDLEINEDWFSTLLWLNTLNITDPEFLIEQYNLEKEILPGHKEKVLEICKRFIEKLKAL